MLPKTDYGAFYYQSLPHCCTPDNLKAKLHRRHNRFQDWLSYQTKCQNSGTSMLIHGTDHSNNNYTNNRAIFPSNRNETVRITHQKRFESKCNDDLYDNQQYQNSFIPCGEDGLVRI